MKITEEAISLITGDRKKDYGDISESFNRIAGLWSVYLDKNIDCFDVAKMMILLKISRAKSSNHRDSYVDIVGYIECIEQLLERSNEIKKPISGL